MNERLFSYGTLQLESVQMAQFGRRLEGVADALTGWRLDQIAIADPAVVRLSGARYHSIAVETGCADDIVPGLVFTVSAPELARADAYEVDDYRRVRTALRSGIVAWVYIAANLSA